MKLIDYIATEKGIEIMNNAETFIKNHQQYFTKQNHHTGYECSYDEIDNNELIELIADACNFEEEILEQDTYSFGDGSYITRNEDNYFSGSDVADFRVTASSKDQK